MQAPAASLENTRRRGRPAEFDRARALNEAMRLFGQRGYEGTSLDELLEAMSISASSFYNSFGSKDRLYEAVLDHYVEGPGRWFAASLAEPGPARQVFARLLERAVDALADPDMPCGCMVSLEGTHLPPDLAPVRDCLLRFRRRSEAMLTDRLARAVAEGELPPGTDVPALAAFVAAVLRGMAVQARDGVDRGLLREVARLAIRAWPAPLSPSR
jgi:AcrR family transcriptional regulator